jgi:hypothetical protein
MSRGVNDTNSRAPSRPGYGGVFSQDACAGGSAPDREMEISGQLPVARLPYGT